MVNNSANINIMNNHLSPQTIEHKKKEHVRHMTLTIQVLVDMIIGPKRTRAVVIIQ